MLNNCPAIPKPNRAYPISCGPTIQNSFSLKIDQKPPLTQIVSGTINFLTMLPSHIPTAPNIVLTTKNPRQVKNPVIFVFIRTFSKERASEDPP